MSNMSQLNGWVSHINDSVWAILLFLLVGTGIFFSIRTRFVQCRRFGKSWNRVFGDLSLNGERAGSDGMSSFQALATAVAGQVGTGNIAGCATALVQGGPGAIFWMWVSAFFGMATIYGETTLAQATKTRNGQGETVGGPVYYIRKAFTGGFGKFLAGFFAIMIILALGLMGNMVQSNSISNAFNAAFRTPKLLIGIICALIAAFIFIGGLSRIASFTEKVVPIMALLYVGGCIICLCIFHEGVGPAFKSIFKYAFTPYALTGAGAGILVREAMHFGVARGLFSNEAGMGSTPHAHALAKVEKPADQGEVAMVGVFIDTFVVLTLTALVILSSGVLPNMIEQGITGVEVAQEAFANALNPKGGPGFIAIIILFFAFSTIISWYFFAKQNISYLFGYNAIKPFSYLVVVAILVGALLKVELVWNLSDLFNGLMALPNLIALLVLSKHVVEMSYGKNIKL